LRFYWRISPIADLCAGVRAPLTSSETTIGGMTATPSWSASSTAFDPAAKKSIHTDVSMTTPATASSLVRIDVELQLPAVRQRPLIEPASLDVLETLDERLRNALTGHLESRIEKIRGKIRRHPARR